MLIKLLDSLILDPYQYTHRLVLEFDVGEDHTECGLFSGMYAGFEEPWEMNQRIEGEPLGEGEYFQKFEIVAPNRSRSHQLQDYHYVAINWENHVYAAYPRSTEIVLRDSAGSWSVIVERGEGVTVTLNDYNPWKDRPSI